MIKFFKKRIVYPLSLAEEIHDRSCVLALPCVSCSLVKPMGCDQVIRWIVHFIFIFIHDLSGQWLVL